MTSTPAISSTTGQGRPLTQFDLMLAVNEAYLTGTAPDWSRERTVEEVLAFWGRLAVGGARLREALCSVPFYAKATAAVRAEAIRLGQDPELAEAKFWMEGFADEINLIRPPTQTSEATAACWMDWLRSEAGLPASPPGGASSTAAA
jgi:hypothetical protein